MDGKRLWANISTGVLALVLSVFVWVIANYEIERPRDGFYPMALPLSIQNAPSGSVVTNEPAQSVQVYIRAFASSWETLKPEDFAVTADWQGLDEGLHNIPITVTCADRSVTIISIHPESMYVQLERTWTVETDVSVELTDMDEVPLGYRVYPPVIEPITVMVRGAVSAVERVAHISATVSVAGEKAPIERQLVLRALDESLTPVEGVQILPSNVSVRIAVEKKENFREVAVLARTSGLPARGYFVSSVSTSPPTVTLVGPPGTMEAMSSVIQTLSEVDITGLTQNVGEKLTLALPEGVTVLGTPPDQPFEVVVTVGIDAVTGGTTVVLPLKVKRLGEGLTAQISVPEVDVILTGPAVVLDELQTDLLDAYVDLSGLGIGTHQVRPSVDIIAPDESPLQSLQINSILPEVVDVTVSKPPTPTLEPTPTDTPADTPETPTLYPTVTPTPEPTPESVGTSQ